MTGSTTGRQPVATVFGVLAAVVLGLSAGAVLAEGGVLVPWWRSMPPPAFLSWYRENASRLVDFFGPLEVAGAILATAAAALYRRQGAGGRLFVVAAVLAWAVLGTFPLYFERVNATFAAGTIEPEKVPQELARWASWHWARTAIAVLACGAAVLAVRAAGARQGARP